MAESSAFDYVVLGGGPAGYPCAIRLSQRGFKVACVDGRSCVDSVMLGGTCLREGCIPSKCLLDKTWKYYDAKSHFSDYGINCSDVTYNLERIHEHKNEMLLNLSQGIDYLFKANGVEKVNGFGHIVSNSEVLVANSDGGQTHLKASLGVIIATGSRSSSLPGFDFDGKHIVSSSEALEFDSAPESLIVIGGGAIGLELGSVWSRLGSKVTVIEYCDRILPNMDSDMSSCLLVELKKQGLEFLLSTKVSGYSLKNGKVEVNCGQSSVLAEKVLVAVGRAPESSNLGIEVKKDSRGFIKVDDKFQTSVQNIFAIGDVIGGPMLAHKAEDEGIALADILSGNGFYLSDVPSVVYTHPEAASVGRTEAQIKDSGIEYDVGIFPFNANSRAKIVNESAGFVKIISDSGNNNSILGVHIVGPQAGVLIGEACVALAYGASPEDIALICHSHPDFNEALKEAAMSSYFNPIHNKPKRKNVVR